MAGAGGATRVLTCGSVLALTMGTHVNLVEDYYAPGSIGQFSIQLSVAVDNYARTPVTPELVIVCMNSGSFATERGTSSTYTALLTKRMCWMRVCKNQLHVENILEWLEVVS